MITPSNYIHPRYFGQQPYSFARSSGHLIQGHGMMAAPNLMGAGSMHVSKIFGTGGKEMQHGLMPGEHMVPEHHVQRAMFHYKHIRNLPHNQHLPPAHIMSIIEQAHRHSNINPMNPHVRGGFLPGLLPMLAGTILPLVGKAAMPLLNGAMGALGARLGNIGRGNGLPTTPDMHHHQLFGHGVPRRVIGPNRDAHWHIHGEGFRDWISKAYRKIRGVATSEPVRMMGAHALQTIKDALMKALTEKVNGWTGDTVTKLVGSRVEPNTSIAEERAAMKAREAQGLNPPAYDELSSVNPDGRLGAPSGGAMPKKRGRGRPNMKNVKRMRPYDQDLY